MTANAKHTPLISISESLRSGQLQICMPQLAIFEPSHLVHNRYTLRGMEHTRTDLHFVMLNADSKTVVPTVIDSKTAFRNGSPTSHGTG